MSGIPTRCLLRRRRVRTALRLTLSASAATAVLLALPAAASADPSTLAAANDLPTVVANLRNWLMGILAAIATLFGVLAGVYWASAGGDSAQVEKAKSALRNALVGYALAVLSPVLLAVVRGIVGG